MERRISDLLDGARLDSVDFAGAPAVSKERIKELTMKKIAMESAGQTNNYTQENWRNRGNYAPRRRRFAAVLLAAVLTFALATGAVAANVFGIGDYFKSVFGVIDEEQAAVLEALGTTDTNDMPPPQTSGGTTITPLAAVGDEDWYYLALHIEAPEGTVLAQGESYFQIWNPDGPLNSDILPYQIDWDETAAGDNAIDAVFRFGTNDGPMAAPTSGVSQIFRINGLWIQSPDKVYTKILDGVWEFDIGLYGAKGKYTELPVDGLKTVAKSEGQTVHSKDGGTMAMPDVELTLRSMAISPLGLRCAYSYENVDTDYFVPGVITEVIMKDGSAVEVINGGGEYNEEGAKFNAYFGAPVQLDQIDFIRYGDLEIKVQ